MEVKSVKRVTLDVDDGIDVDDVTDDNETKRRIAFFKQVEGNESVSSWGKSTSLESGYGGSSSHIRHGNINKRTTILLKTRPHTASAVPHQGRLIRAQSTLSLPTTKLATPHRPLSSTSTQRTRSTLSHRPHSAATLSSASEQAPLDVAYIRRLLQQERQARAAVMYQDVTDAKKATIQETFHRLLRKAKLVVRLFRAMKLNSCEKHPRTPVETQYYALHDHPGTKQLAFNPADYSNAKVRQGIPMWAKRILWKSPDVRTEAECRKLHALLRGLPGLDKFAEKIQFAMCRAFCYMHVEPPRIILRLGHVGLHYYLIFSGTVFVNTVKGDKNTLDQEYPPMQTRAVLGRGDAFGEIALLRDGNRTASITCRQDCELLLLDKDVFARVCPSIFQGDMEHKVKFLSDHPWFKSKLWSIEKLKSLSMEAQIQEYKTNKVVVKDSNDNEWLYMCMDGECRVIKCMTTDKPQPETSVQGKQHDYALTADFLHNQRRKSIKADDFTRRLSFEMFKDRRKSTVKKDMLTSMGLSYVKQEKRELLDQAKMKQQLMDFRQQHVDEVMTFDNLMKLRKQLYPDKHFIYLHMGVLREGDVFNLEDILQNSPGSGNKGSCQIVVSCGSKLLKFKKSLLMEVNDGRALDHIRLLALKNRLPADEELLTSYKREAKWTAYKHFLTRQVLAPVLQQNKWRPLVKYEEKFNRFHIFEQTCLVQALRPPSRGRAIHRFPAGQTHQLYSEENCHEEQQTPEQEQNKRTVTYEQELQDC